MLIPFFYHLRDAKVPVSVKEYLTLLEALRAQVVGPANEGACSMTDFYHLARLILVKDEKNYDKFDQAFASYFEGVERTEDMMRDLPQDWLKANLENNLSQAEREQMEKMGWDELMKTLQERLEEQKERHEGGSKWIGTGGRSPFGNSGVNPQGVRIGGSSRSKSAVRVWERRAYQDYAEDAELGPRTMRVALKRLRRFARQGGEQELALGETIRATAHNAGLLDIVMRPERRNQVKVLLLMDVGGSMDEHIAQVQALFSAAKSEFKHLEFYYFHNCVYDFVWRNNQRRFSEKVSTWDVLRTYNKDYKLIFVGDATMSPYEILQPGGCLEYYCEGAGADWLTRLLQAFPKFAWINPEPQALWQYRQSIGIMQKIMQNRMYPLSLQGLEDAMRLLSK